MIVSNWIMIWWRNGSCESNKSNIHTHQPTSNMKHVKCTHDDLHIKWNHNNRWNQLRADFETGSGNLKIDDRNLRHWLHWFHSNNHGEIEKFYLKFYRRWREWSAVRGEKIVCISWQKLIKFKSDIFEFVDWAEWKIFLMVFRIFAIMFGKS